MKLIQLSLFSLTLLLFSCGSSDSETSSKSESKIDPNGPKIEVNVLSFDIEKRETIVEIINRMDEAITSISGRLYFYDADGELVTTATGRDLSSPFQATANPNLVKSMDSKEHKLHNNIPDGTESIRVEEITGKTQNGTF